MKKVVKAFWIIVSLGLCVFVFFCIAIWKNNGNLAQMRGHGTVTTQKLQFHVSSKQLNNPNRGFYYMRGFRITDEQQNYRKNVADMFYWDEETNLAMMQINLQYYNDKAITKEGLANLEELFKAMKKTNKQFIIRFLYDWNGENLQYEPENIEIILKHMEQIGPLLQEYQDIIFVIQGLFIGNWGEMNGTKYANEKDIRTLAEKLAAVTSKKTYLSVRMPMYWRIATGLGEVTGLKREDETLALRMGLYNDGLLGSWSDYGTYGNHTREQHGDFTYWNREEELAFQEELCKLTPNGGETIVDNPYNDWENAVRDFARMHVTYLNADFDKNVLNKWAGITVKEEGCYNGMDGLAYMERHLGYRLFLKQTSLKYQFKTDILSMEAEIANAGFAPLYKDTEVYFVLYQEETGEVFSYKVETDLRNLAGGRQSDQTMTLHKEISLKGKSAQEYIVYLNITDSASKQRILLGNEEEPEELGYRLGSITLEPIDEKLYYGQNEYCEKLFTGLSAILQEE